MIQLNKSTFVHQSGRLVYATIPIHTFSVQSKYNGMLLLLLLSFPIARYCFL